MGEVEESREKAKELQGKKAFRKKRERKAKKVPDTALSFSFPFPCSPRKKWEKSPCYCEGSCCWPGLCLQPGSRPELGVGSKAAMGAGDLPQKG